MYFMYSNKKHQKRKCTSKDPITQANNKAKFQRTGFLFLARKVARIKRMEAF